MYLLIKNCDDCTKINYAQRAYSDVYECISCRSNRADVIHVKYRRTTRAHCSGGYNDHELDFADRYTWASVVVAQTTNRMVFTVFARRKTTLRANNLQYAKSENGGARHGSQCVTKRTGDITKQYIPNANDRVHVFALRRQLSGRATAQETINRSGERAKEPKLRTRHGALQQARMSKRFTQNKNMTVSYTGS